VKLLKSKGLKLYCFHIIVRDGDHEYLSPGIVRGLMWRTEPTN